MTPRIKILEARVYAAGRAFACDESDLELRVVPRSRLARLAALLLAAGGAPAALIHYCGSNDAFPAWRSQS